MTDYLKIADPEWFKQRVTGIVFCVFAAFALLAVRLFHLQVIGGEEYRRLSASNCIRLESIDAPRGLIFDRTGDMMVDNRPAFDVSIIPRDARPVEETVGNLAGLLHFTAEELMEKIREKRRLASYKPVLLRKDIGRNTLAAIEVQRYDLPGVVINVTPRRHYLYDQSAAHVLGYLGEISNEELSCGKFPDCRPGDFVGKFGVEKTFESVLRGERGGRQVEVNAKGQVVRVLQTVDARPGHNVYLTIDRGLQQKAEEMLRGAAGAVVAMDPGTGEILAMVSSPSFDQNAFVSGMTYDQWEALISNPNRPMENKAVQGEYPPASTYKIVTAIAGLEEGVIDEKTTFYCPGFHRFGNRVYRCWKKGGHGSVEVVRALAESCDVFFYQVGQRVGVDRLAQYATALGLGSPTGVALDHEADGLVPTSAWKRKKTGIPWQGGENLSIAIGQGYNLVTPIQMLGLFAAIGNGGIQYRPQILKRIENTQGEVVRSESPTEAARIEFSGKTMELVRRGLWEAVNTVGGTAFRSRWSAVDISGKTGTAQVVGRKEEETADDQEEVAHYHKDHAWFVAYAPSEEPKIAVAVIVEHGEHGSSTAAPIARAMIETYLGGKSGGQKLAKRE
ncbi:MAG: penicillin-binding protein 2 [Desulfobacterales bacterium]|nr:penicillin-binding protein 2 [Desulfobacterales bacterium]MCF8080293.1 penicillin-binding protein 2 [Desulfobacterales bacterium]